ncbi:MAG: hypothetical protein NTZ90_13580 [Proteobacteria bacterium]|nr:hypothetical protein [Pseudomonadota bacterium]
MKKIIGSIFAVVALSSAPAFAYDIFCPSFSAGPEFCNAQLQCAWDYSTSECVFQ